MKYLYLERHYYNLVLHMSDEYPIDRWFRRRRLPFFTDYFEDMIREMERWFEEEMKFFEKNIPRELIREIRTPTGIRREVGPLVWGYSITIGPDGKPIVREFGNFRPGRRGEIVEVRTEREPLVDVLNEEEQIRVVAEIPGVNKEDINLSVVDNRLRIKVDTEQRKYYKEIDLPEEVDPDSAKASYRNGVLEVILKKKKAEKPAKSIKIE
jgi:HSP20 family protein